MRKTAIHASKLTSTHYMYTKTTNMYKMSLFDLYIFSIYILFTLRTSFQYISITIQSLKYWNIVLILKLVLVHEICSDSKAKRILYNLSY